MCLRKGQIQVIWPFFSFKYETCFNTSIPVIMLGWILDIEYWMIYRRPGFLAIVCFGSSHAPPSPISKLSLFLNPTVCRRSSTLSGEGGRREGEGGAKSYDGEKAWSSVTHSILSGGPALPCAARWRKPGWIRLLPPALCGTPHPGMTSLCRKILYLEQCSGSGAVSF